MGLLDALPAARGPYTHRVDRFSDFNVTILDQSGRARLTLDVSGVEDHRLSAPQGADVADHIAAIVLEVLNRARASEPAPQADPPASPCEEVDAAPTGPPSLPAPTSSPVAS